MANIYICVTLAIVLKILLMQGTVSGAGLVVEPLWDASRNDTDTCQVTLTGNRTLYRGSINNACNLIVTAAQGDLIVLEIGRGDYVEPSYLYVKRVGELEECPNRYVAFEKNTETCNSIFIHSNLEIVLQGNISVSVRSIPVMETLPSCPEFEQGKLSHETGRTNVCKNVKGYRDILTCASYYGSDYCRIYYRTKCNAVLGPNEVVYQCKDELDIHIVMIVYSLKIITLSWSKNNLINIKARSFQDLQVLQALNLRQNYLETLDVDSFKGLSNLKELILTDNRLVTLDVGLFNGLHALWSLELSSGRLRDLYVELLFQELNNLTHLLLNGNELSSIPNRLFMNLVNLKTLNLAHNQIAKLDAEIFLGLSSLEDLYLDHNLLNTLPEGVFDNLVNLQVINLGYNVISNLDDTLFYGLNKLKKIFI